MADNQAGIEYPFYFYLPPDNTGIVLKYLATLHFYNFTVYTVSVAALLSGLGWSVLLGYPAVWTFLAASAVEQTLLLIVASNI